MDFIKALQDLNTAFKLPDASISLCEDLRKWRKEVEHLFPVRGDKRRGDRDSRRWGPDLASDDKMYPQAAVGDNATKGRAFIDNHTQSPFVASCKALAERLRQFSTAFAYLAESRELDNSRDCRAAVGKLIVTITEIHATMIDETKHYDGAEEDLFNENPENGNYNAFLRDFVRARINASHVQLNGIESSMTSYCIREIPRVQTMQKQTFEALANVTQVSTFFAGVVASTLSFSLSFDKQTPAIVGINALWLGSLVLGIGSAFNSLLAMTMRKVVSLTPLNAQPWYIRFWIRQSYVALLVAAVIMYVFGLGVFVITTQHAVAAAIPCVLGGGCAVGISIVTWQHVWDFLVDWWRA